MNVCVCVCECRCEAGCMQANVHAFVPVCASVYESVCEHMHLCVCVCVCESLGIGGLEEVHSVALRNH